MEKKKVKCWYDLRRNCILSELPFLKRDCDKCSIGKILSVKESKPLTLEQIDKLMDES